MTKGSTCFRARNLNDQDFQLAFIWIRRSRQQERWVAVDLAGKVCVDDGLDEAESSPYLACDEADVGSVAVGRGSERSAAAETRSLHAW